MNHTERFRKMLQQTLVERVKQNPQYSLRSFARVLDIESSALSQIINGKRALTEKMCLRLGHKMNLAPDEVAALVGREVSEDVAFERDHQNTFKQFASIDIDSFKVIADWHHYAILELTQVEHFQSNAKWVAKALGLSVHEVHDAVRRLVRLDFMEIAEDGTWRDLLGDANNVGSEFTALAFRRLQKQILEKAIIALEKTNYDERMQTSMTMAISKAKLKNAKKKVYKFIEELHDYLRSGEKKDEVYQMSFSLYPVSETNKELKDEN